MRRKKEPIHRPCPFCGEIGHLRVSLDTHEQHLGYLCRIKCYWCGSSGPDVYYDEKIYNADKALDIAFDKWDKRPIEDDLRNQMDIMGQEMVGEDL